MMKMLFLILTLLTSLSATAAQITAAVDRSPVSLNESFTLTYSADETPDGNPDFEPLTQNFDILNQGHSSQSSWVNGKSSTTIKWTLQLMAKQAGDFIIPAIAFGKDRAEGLPLKVVSSKTGDNVDTNEDLILKVEASPLNPYVQSQVLYTLRLLRKVNITQARLDEPKLQDAIVKKIGEDSTFNTQVKGVDYVVTERKYAIFPQKSGTVKIAPLTLTAEVLDDNNSRFNGFFNQSATRIQKVISDPVTLEVRPAPTNAQMPHWLPAEELQLKQEWSGDFNNMKVGEPLTHTLFIIAKGTSDGLLPELNTPSNNPQLKTYPDQPIVKEVQKPEGTYSMREEKVAIIPSSAGTYTLPAIEVPWFNTQTQQVQKATLPAITLTVLAANGATAAATPPPLVTPVITAPAAVTMQPTTVLTTSLMQSNKWPWIALFLGLGWLSTLVYFLTKGQAVKVAVNPEPTTSTTFSGIAPQLKLACQNNDSILAKQALLEWGLVEFKVTNLVELANFCDARLRDEILVLNQSLYAPTDNNIDTAHEWQGKNLLKAFSEHNATHRMQANHKAQDDKLEPLYRL